ncbi:MAG: hypothetical protein R3244_04900 [Thermoanaerobaculia bacterium]|nr:hypothetical protein [Thermoanaerobaculia bacterium]
MAVLREGRGDEFDPVLLDAFEPIAAEIDATYYDLPADELETELDRLMDRYFSGGLDALQVG